QLVLSHGITTRASVLPFNLPASLRTDIFITSSTHISDFCPSSAPDNCPPKRRSSATKRQLEAAKPQPAAIPMNMRSLVALKRSKLAVPNFDALSKEEER
ncbi:hypothetical protein FRB95_006866, partial [Tulasnella sp. JGI-2019a]